MKLYWFETLNPRKVCTAARYLGLSLDYQRVDLAKGEHRTPEFKRINPNGRVPALVDGDTTLWESAAICTYLASDSDSGFWPGDTKRQAEVMRWTSWGSQHWTPAVGVYYFEHYVKRVVGLGAPDTTRFGGAEPQVHALATLLDEVLAGRDFLVPGRFTLADVVVGSILPDWEGLGMPLAKYTHIRRWLDDRLMRIDAFREPWPG